MRRRSAVAWAALAWPWSRRARTGLDDLETIAIGPWAASGAPASEAAGRSMGATPPGSPATPSRPRRTRAKGAASSRPTTPATMRPTTRATGRATGLAGVASAGPPTAPVLHRGEGLSSRALQRGLRQSRPDLRALRRGAPLQRPRRVRLSVGEGPGGSSREMARQWPAAPRPRFSESSGAGPPKLLSRRARAAAPYPGFAATA